MTAANSLEQRLLAGYADQLTHYEGALAILHRAQTDSADANTWVQDLHAVLIRLTALDAALEADRAAWREAAGTPGGELRALCKHIAERIDALAKGVQERMSELETRKTDLLPKLDALIQKRRMRDAYAKHGGIATYGAAST